MKRYSFNYSVLLTIIFLCSLTSGFSQIKMKKTIKKPTNKVLLKKIPKVTLKKGIINLVSPVNGDQKVSTSTTFQWEPINGVTSYNLKYMILQPVGNPAIPFTTISDIENTSYQLVLENGRVYLWQVYCSDSNGFMHESNIRSFTTENTPPNVVSNISPQDSEINVNRNTRLTWNPASDPDGDSVYYMVLLHKIRSFVAFEQGYAEGVIVSSSQTQTSYQTTNLEPGINYYWRVESRDGRGAKTRSPIWSFKTDPVSWTAPITTGSFIDTRDNNTYQTVTIGAQTWMAENLAYLPSINNIVASDQWYTDRIYKVLNYNGNSISEAKSSSEFQKYGVYYNFKAANSSCPTGWHLPSDTEWKQLETYLGMPTEDLDRVFYNRGKVIAGLLREVGTTNWLYTTDDVNNLALFNAKPSGYGWYNNWHTVGTASPFWTSTGLPPSTEFPASIANPASIRSYSRAIGYNPPHPTYPQLEVGSLSRQPMYNYMFSCVRCVRD